jgi:hypothetical protein
MAERFNRTPLQRLYAESMMRANPKHVDFVHAEMVRCAKLIAAKGILCEPAPRVVVSRTAQMQPVMFDPPNRLVIHFLSIPSMEQLKVNMREAMASYAMQMDFERQKTSYRTALPGENLVRPQFNPYKSAVWAYALSWFSN